MVARPQTGRIPHTNRHGLVGNIDWGESLVVVSYEFLGPNTTKVCNKKNFIKEKITKLSGHTTANQSQDRQPQTESEQRLGKYLQD